MDLWKRYNTFLPVPISLLLLLILSLCISGYKHWQTDIVDAKVVNKRYYAEYKFSKWTADRKYNRSSLPNCVWDVEKDTYYVCDEYSCLSRDSLGYCEIEGPCIRGHYETDYNYNIMEWKSFQELEVHSSNKIVPKSIQELLNDPKHYRLERKKEHYYTTLQYKWNTREFKYSTTSDHVRVKIRKRNNKILKIL